MGKYLVNNAKRSSASCQQQQVNSGNIIPFRKTILQLKVSTKTFKKDVLAYTNMTLKRQQTNREHQRQHSMYFEQN